MSGDTYSIIVGTGSYVPAEVIPNSSFIENKFYNKNGLEFDKPNEELIEKMEEITGINERRYLSDEQVTSDMAFLAAEDALSSSRIDPESLDYIVVGHNFGDVKVDNRRSDFVPSLAARVKHRLGIKTHKTICYDISCGCPGWLQAVIQVDYFLKSGDAKRALVIGAEALSRISDPHDRDSMIYADGAGAVILEATRSDTPVGILSHAARSDTIDHACMLWLDKTYSPTAENNDLYLKMNGHQLYKYAISTMPLLTKECLDKAGLDLSDVNKFLVHQANAKMDETILKRLFKLYDRDDVPEGIMPMIIAKLGNSSVATIPTLLDMIQKGKLENDQLKKGDIALFASVGAGMNINSLTYRMP